MNKIVTDLSSALIINWLAWIWNFDYIIKHVFENRHITTNELSDKFAIEKQIWERDNEKNIDDFIQNDLKLIFVRVNIDRATFNNMKMKNLIENVFFDSSRILDESYFDKFKKIVN